MPLPTVVFDFDGTIAQGDGPVLAYARHAAAVADDPGLFEAALAALADLVNGKSPYRDAYDAVARVAQTTARRRRRRRSRARSGGRASRWCRRPRAPAPSRGPRR